MVWVWIDTLPQRNCSRFSRLSPLPECGCEKNNEPPAKLHPADDQDNAQACATVGKTFAFPVIAGGHG